MRKIIYTICLFLLPAMMYCSDDLASSFHCPLSYQVKGSRLLGMDLLDESETGTFEEGLEGAKQAGIDFISLHLTWTQIETSQETYTDPYGGALAAFNTLCSDNSLKLSLTIKPIDMTGKTVPADLSSTRFNNAVFISRFKSLLDYIFGLFDYTKLTSLQIGNEIDGYDTSPEDPAFWSDYGAFLFEIRNYVQANYPGLKIGFTGTLHGLTEGALHDLGVFTALAGVVDVVGVTYYPINSDFTVKDPSVVETDISKLVSEFPGKTIFLQEAGYQTGEKCGSSERMQSMFICSLFQSWDMYRDRIGLVNFVRLQDISLTSAEGLASPYGISDEKFIEYLRTLGLRTYPGKGTDKEGMYILKQQAKLRGW